MQENNRENKKRSRTGFVVSDKMEKTVVVAVERLFKHPLYKKTIKRLSRFKAHDEKNSCKTGDRVEIIETKPISKDKRWRVAKILGAERDQA